MSKELVQNFAIAVLGWLFVLGYIAVLVGCAINAYKNFRKGIPISENGALVTIAAILFITACAAGYVWYMFLPDKLLR